MATHARRTPAPATPRPAERPAARRPAPPQAAALALQAAAGNRAAARVLQRYVMKRASPKGWRYFSSWDQSTAYETEEEALEADARLEAANLGTIVTDPELRYPTLYSYSHTRATSQMTGKPQGPHTAAHVSVAHAFGALTTRAEWMTLLYEQIADPDELLKRLLAERGGTEADLAMEFERYVYDYRSLYEHVERMLWDPKSDPGALKDGLARLLELDPYGTYGWKGKAKASKRSIRGKGERRDKAEKDVDKGGRWRDQENYDNFIAKRRRLSTGAYKLAVDESKAEEARGEGQYLSMDELLAAVARGEEKVGNTVQVYPTGEWIIKHITLKSSDGSVTGARIRLGRRGG